LIKLIELTELIPQVGRHFVPLVDWISTVIVFALCSTLYSLLNAQSSKFDAITEIFP